MQTLVGQSVSESVERFWDDYVAQTNSSRALQLYEVFFFEDHEVGANELGQLVLDGVKRATASSLWGYESEGKALPEAGELSIVTNWHGEPLCVIETTQVDVVPFSDVSEEFAAVEGEGDGSLRYWREGHRDYFGRECSRLGKEFSDEMPVVCERFAVRYTHGG